MFVLGISYTQGQIGHSIEKLKLNYSNKVLAATFWCRTTAQSKGWFSHALKSFRAPVDIVFILIILRFIYSKFSTVEVKVKIVTKILAFIHFENMQ